MQSNRLVYMTGDFMCNRMPRPTLLAFSETLRSTPLTISRDGKNSVRTQSVSQNPGFNNPAYPTDDYSLPKGSPGVGFVVFDPTQAGRSNPVSESAGDSRDVSDQDLQSDDGFLKRDP
jgi:hypothetical protein